MNTTEKAIKAFWKRSNKPVVEINITDDFIADLQRQADDFCTPGKPPAVASRPSPHNKGTAAAAAQPRPAAVPAPEAEPGRPTAKSTGVGF